MWGFLSVIFIMPCFGYSHIPPGNTVQNAHERVRSERIWGTKPAAAGTFFNDGTVMTGKAAESKMLEFAPAIFKTATCVSQCPIPIKSALGRLTRRHNGQQVPAAGVA